MYQGLRFQVLIYIWIVLSCLMALSNGLSGYCQNYQESWNGDLIIPTTPPPSRRYYYSSNHNNREEIKYVEVCENATFFSLCGTCWKILYRKSNISVIHTNANQEASNLKVIQISGLEIERIETGAFAHLPNLRNLNLEFNNLQKIARGTFNSLPSLSSLNLSHNVIGLVEEESFHGSFELDNLDLSFNKISLIPNNTFQHSNLLILRMSNNLLSTLADDFCKSLPNLNKLVLDHNFLDRVPSCLNESRVYHLSLKFNSITSLNDTDLPSTLDEFFISNNKLRFIHKNTFLSLSDLRILDLSDNHLVKIHVECFKNNGKLDTLDISGIGMGNIDPEMLNFTGNLQEFRTARNNISSLPNGIFEKLSNLKILDLSANEINFLQLGLLKNLSSLQNLNLSHNDLEYLQTGVLRGLNSLEVLDLSSNKLEMFRFHNLRSLTKLRFLHLESNLLDIIDASDFENFSKNSHVSSLTVSLDGNKIACTTLATIISKPNIKLMEGKTFATENIDGISCSDNVTIGTKTNIEESLSEMRHFFQNDLKKFLNTKTEGATRQDLHEIVEYLHRNFTNHLAENFNVHVKEFMEFENASFHNFLKELDVLVSKLTDVSEKNENASLENLSLTLREEMKSFITFENSSFQQFMVKMSEIVDKENRISTPIQSGRLVSSLEIEKSTELIQALNQLKVFMILCTIVLLVVLALKMVPRFKKRFWMESEKQSHEMPILS